MNSRPEKQSGELTCSAVIKSQEEQQLKISISKSSDRAFSSPPVERLKTEVGRQDQGALAPCPLLGAGAGQVAVALSEWGSQLGKAGGF